MKYPYRDKTTGRFARATVQNLPNYRFLDFVSNSQDTHMIREHLGGIDGIAHAYDSFFVIVENGDFDAVWGMPGVVPYNTKPLVRLV